MKRNQDGEFCFESPDEIREFLALVQDRFREQLAAQFPDGTTLTREEALASVALVELSFSDILTIAEAHERAIEE